MAFAAKFAVIDPRKPIIGYIHQSGLESAFSSDTALAVRHAREVVGSNLQHLADVEYVIAALWGMKEVKVTELFGVGYLGEDKNPGVHNWVFHDGIYRPKETEIGCLETMQVVGIESAYRPTVSLDEYLRNPPNLGDLEPPVDLGIIE